MSDKIIITDEEVEEAAEDPHASASPKMVFYEVPEAEESEAALPELSRSWYVLWLIPWVNLVAVGWMLAQKKRRVGHRLLGTVFSVVVTLVASWLLWGRWPVENWKNRLGEQAQSGVVMIDAEDRGWFQDETYLGTGVVVAQKGDTSLILTNRHVVSKSNGQVADALQVRDCQDRRSVARVVGLPKDPEIDMALICVKSHPSLKVLGDIGDYQTLQAGDDVIAIGHPSGLNFTMTEGIVSALRNDMLIQSSALINPGNSGGPLLNKEGRIIGINTFYIRGRQGLNFAFRADFILRRRAWNYYANISDLLDAVTIR